MRKTLILIFILACLGMLLTIVALNRKPSPKAPSSTTITPFPTNPPYYPHKLTSTTEVTSSQPANGATEVGLTNAITINFNIPIKTEDLSISFAPAFPFNQSIARATSIITPLKPLFPNLTYYGFVTVKGIPIYTFSFSTVTDNTIQAPDFANDIQQEINRHNYPDHFLASFMPYKTSQFSVFEDFMDQPDEHFAFFITTFGDKTQGQRAFWDWAISTGLTKVQLQSLDIRFVN